MEIDTKRLTPGMVLTQDVLGKSGKAIIAKNTELTEVHIEFIKKFLVETVSVSPLLEKGQVQSSKSKSVIEQKNQLFADHYEATVTEYKKLWASWKNNIPLEMYHVRSTFVPLFEEVSDQLIDTIIGLTRNRQESEQFYYKNVAISLLSVYLAQLVKYEKKDWLQIGFAALLSDIGMTKIDSVTLNKTNQLFIKEVEKHPLYSYKMVENVTTLTQQAKMGILQHHERLDGSGYPAKAVDHKIHPYARIIAISDFFYSNYSQNKAEIIRLIQEQDGKLDGKIVNHLVDALK